MIHAVLLRAYLFFGIASWLYGGPPQRIIAIGPNVAEVICALGACDRIVGVDKFCVFPPELADRPKVGGLFDPDLERIVALNPDLVIVRGRNLAVQQLCERRKTALHHDRTERIADIETGLLELAGLLDRREKGQELAGEFHQRIQSIRQRTAGLPQPRVLLAVSRRPDAVANVLTTGKGTFLDEMLEISGGVNVFGHLDMAWPQISPEAILAQRPEVIIELMPELDLTDDLKRQMTEQWSHLGYIPAAANGRVYFVTDANALIPSPRYVEIIEKVSRILHPHPPLDGQDR